MTLAVDAITNTAGTGTPSFPNGIPASAITGTLPASSVTGALIAVTRFTASGTWTKNSATTKIYVEAMGGGGGGGGGSRTGDTCSGFTTRYGDGGNSGLFINTFSNSPPSSATVTIGAGGSAGAGGSSLGTFAGAGGTTSLSGVLSATGGAGAPNSFHSTLPHSGYGSGGGAAGGQQSAGSAAVANTGGGGGGGGAFAGGNGGYAGGAGGSGWLTVWEFA